jgi:hypothetical protein
MEREENENEYIYKASMIVILLVDPKPVHGPGGVNSLLQKLRENGLFYCKRQRA